MLGDDPELLEDDNQFDTQYDDQFDSQLDHTQQDSQIPSDITSQAPSDLDLLLHPGDQSEPSALPRTSRRGRRINLPARFKD